MAEAAAKKETPAVSAVKTPVAKPKPDSLSFIVLGVVLINLATVGSLGFYMQRMWEKIESLQAETQRLASNENRKQETTLGKELSPPPMGTLYALESFLVNVASDQGAKFL